MTVVLPWENILSLGLPILAIAISIVLYFLKSRNSLALWKTENIYDKIFDEIVDLEEDNQLPGEQRNRFSESGVSDLSSTQIVVMDQELKDELGQYQSLLIDLEEAEQELQAVIPKITEEIPEVLYSVDEDSIRVVVSGVAGDQIDTKGKGEGDVFQSSRPLLSIFDGLDRSELDLDSPEELRNLLTPDNEPSDEINLNNEWSEMKVTNPSHHTIEFWDKNFPDWDQVLFQLLEQGYLERYLVARQKKYNCINELEESSGILRKQIEQRLPTSE